MAGLRVPLSAWRDAVRASTDSPKTGVAPDHPSAGMRLPTDDDIYRARLVYLGSPGYTLPVHLPYAQYVMFVHYLLTFEFDPFPA